MNQLIVLAALFVVGCAGAAKQPTIHGADLYARANELREQGEIVVPSSGRPIKVRLGHYLIDRSRDQIFHVRDVVDGCHGNSLAEDTDCTLALMQSQRFTVTDTVPTPRGQPEEQRDLSDLNKARLVLAAVGTGLAVGAAKCDAFDGCGKVLGVAAGIDGMLLLLLLTGMK